MKKAILFSSLIIVGLFFAIGAEGAFYNYETFDTLGSTTIDHYGYWLGPSYTQPTPGGSGTSTWLHYQFGFSPDNTMYNPGTTTYESIEYSFWFYATSNTNADFAIGTDNIYGADCGEVVNVRLNSPNIYFYTNEFDCDDYAAETVVYTFATGTWYAIQVEKTGQDCAIFVDGVLKHEYNCNFNTKAQIYYYTDGTFDGPFIDNISLYAYGVEDEEPGEYGWLTSYDETQFFPTQPVDCIYNTADSYTAATMTFPVIGHFTNAPSSTINYNDVWIEYTPKTGSPASTSLYSGTSTPNSDIGWAFSDTIAAGTYRIDYFAEGYDIYTFVPKKISSRNCGASIGTSTTPDLALLDWWNTKYYLKCQTAYDECIASSTNVALVGYIEHMLCGIKGFAISLVCPNPETLAKAMGIVDEIKQAFPYSYIMKIKNMGTNLETAATSTTATTSILGQDTGQDLDDFSGLTDIYVVGSANPITTLRTWVGYVMWLVFGIWTIKYVAKEFFT